MKTLSIILVSVVSGAIAGVSLGLMNLGIVEPILDRAIEIEVHSITNSEAVDEQEIQSYRIWQKIVAGIVLGLSFGALLGITFTYGRKLLLPGSNNQRKQRF